MENCANEWNLILFDRYTPVNDKIGYGENRESDYLCILTIYNFLLRTMRRYANLLAVLALSTNLALHAQTNELVIQTKKLGAEIQPTMYGLFFEDINYAADGGLYAELVKNRSFEFPQHLMGWKTYGKVSLMNDGPFERNPHYVRLSNPGHAHKHTGLDNEGFFGIGVKKGEEYRFSVWARLPQGSTKETLRIELVDTQSMGERQALVAGNLTIDSKDWKKYQIILKPGSTHPKSVLRIFLTSKGTVDLEHISLFPVDTWKGHENGLRKDLAQALADIHPGVFRFPGGCIVEGTDLETRYDWKKSVGLVENRPLNENRWQYTFTHRFFPDYYQSYGLGFYEYFLLSEEMGAAPLPILNCGLSCQYQNNDPKAHVAVCDLDNYIQDALDLIEFANGDVNTKWGKVRAEAGHPKPFNLKYIGIGNEDLITDIFEERFTMIFNAIKEKYPEMIVVGTVGPFNEGTDYVEGWKLADKLGIPMVDEHYYQTPGWFLNNQDFYDKYDRSKKTKVYLGEYATHIPGRKANIETALTEALYLAALERNGDVVHMTSYAPLLAKEGHTQWNPDLIYFNNREVKPTTGYYVQKLYGQNAGNEYLPSKITLDNRDDQVRKRIAASIVRDSASGDVIVKLVNLLPVEVNTNVDLSGIGAIQSSAKRTVLTGKPADTPLPVEDTMEVAEKFDYQLPAYSFTVIRIKKANEK